MKLTQTIAAALLSLPLAILNPVAVVSDSGSEFLNSRTNQYELIITFEDGTDYDTIQELGTKYGFTVAKKGTAQDSGQIELISVTESKVRAMAGSTLPEAVARVADQIASEPEILQAQPNYQYKFAAGMANNTGFK